MAIKAALVDFFDSLVVVDWVFVCLLLLSFHFPDQPGRGHRQLGHQGGARGDQRREAASPAPAGHGCRGRGVTRGQSKGQDAHSSGNPPSPVSSRSPINPSAAPLPYVWLQVIAAEGEMNASRALKEASLVIAESPSALQLRYLQTLNTIAAEKNSTIIFPLPMDVLSHFMRK